MLGDATVYALSLYALGRDERWQAGAALAKGGLILAFALGILIESAVKIAQGVMPSSTIMLIVTTIAPGQSGLPLAALGFSQAQR
jgi:Co/Zn/Cd efflux system component